MKKTIIGIGVGVILGVGTVLATQPALDPTLDPGRHPLAFVAQHVERVLPAPYRVTCHRNWTIIGKTCDIRLSSEIVSADVYRPLLQLLDSAGSFDRMNFYMKGYGGSVESTFQLQRAIQGTAADTYAYVIGDVYSADAYLSTFMKHLIVKPNTIFMFHRSSFYGQEQAYCNDVKGKKDRTQSAYNKCLDYAKAFNKQDARWVSDTLLRLLGQVAVNDVLAGRDVIVEGELIQKNFDALQQNKPITPVIVQFNNDPEPVEKDTTFPMQSST